jgi:hypothetical protein
MAIAVFQAHFGLGSAKPIPQTSAVRATIFGIRRLRGTVFSSRRPRSRLRAIDAAGDGLFRQLIPGVYP